MPARTGRRWREVTVPRILRRDGGICHLCGDPGANTADHLVPHAHGGTDDPRNLAACHIGCNKRRGTRPVDVVRAEIAAERTGATSLTGWSW